MNSIKLGRGALVGRYDDSSSSLKMENLPNLTSITSDGYSFICPRSVTLSNIPNLQTVDLPHSFEKIKSKSITNVSPILADLLPFTLDDCDPNSISISISNDVVTALDLLDFSRFFLLEELIIGNNCFENVDILKIDGLNELKSIKIGMNSFTKKESSWGDFSRSFAVLNCAELESIEIGLFSFRDYDGGFKLNNLPKLLTIKIGERGRDSANFYYSSFEIEDLPHLNSIELGDSAFDDSPLTVISNLPHLKSIKLGEYALQGRYPSSSSLKMENLPILTSITSDRGSFQNPRSVTLSSLILND